MLKPTMLYCYTTYRWNSSQGQRSTSYISPKYSHF